jgi:Mrp family chromosome partitioning ATPase
LPSNPGELLISPVTREFIEEAKREYDHILFDCPPLTAIDDTFCLLNLADGLLFIVKAGQTSMRFAKNALMAVRQRGADIIGVVLNGITTDHPSYYYNYYYHAYYNKELTPTNTSSQVKPAKKMAERRRKIPSIDIEAQARAGQMASSDDVTAEERKKAEQFKARRAAQRHPAGGNATPGTSDSSSANKPKESQES